MPLRLTQIRSFEVRCNAAGGESFKATFRVMTDDEAATFFSDESLYMPLDAQKAFLRAAVMNLAELVDDQGQSIPFSKDVLEQAISMADLRHGLLQGYRRGLEGAKAGN